MARVRDAMPFRAKLVDRCRAARCHETGLHAARRRRSRPQRLDEGSDFAGERFAANEDLVPSGGRRGASEWSSSCRPRLHSSASRLQAEETYVGRLVAGGFAHLDYRTAPFLTPAHFYDGGHLNREGAELFSRRGGQGISRTGAGRAA